MPNTSPIKAIRIPLAYSFIRNKTDSYQQIQKHVKELYPDVTDEFAGKIAEQYIRRKLKDDHKGLLDTITTVNSKDLKELGTAALNSNDYENNQKYIALTAKLLNENNSNPVPAKPEVSSGNMKDKALSSTDGSDVPQKNKSKSHGSSIKSSSSSANKMQWAVIQILPTEICYEDFRRLTNVEEGIRKDIMKKYPKDYEKYLARIEKFIKRYYENTFVYESQWPVMIKFHDSSIRTLEDLNRVKLERLKAGSIPPKETRKDTPGTFQQIDSTAMVNEINPSPDLFPSSGESKDENNRSVGTCAANTSERIQTVESDDVSKIVESNTAIIEEIIDDLNIPLEVTNSQQCSQILGRSLPDLHEEKTKLTENQPSNFNNNKFSTCSQLSCDKQITILPRELSFDDFKSFTDIESYVRNDIITKFPASPEKHLSRIDKYIKKLIQQHLIHCEKWPKTIKFNNPSIRNIEDLNRIKQMAHSLSENRNLYLEEKITDEPYDCEEFEATVLFDGVSSEAESTIPFQPSMMESVKSVDETQEFSSYLTPNVTSRQIEIDENGCSVDVSLIGNNECNLSKSFLQTLNDVTFCDVADIPNSNPSQTVNSQDVDPLILKSEYLNLMNISSSGSSLISNETVIFKIARRKTIHERRSCPQALPGEDVPQENAHIATFPNEQIHPETNENISPSDYISSSVSVDLTNRNMQLINTKKNETVTNEELSVLRELSRRLSKREREICRSIELESDEPLPLSLITGWQSACAALREFKENNVTVNPIEDNKQAHDSTMIKHEVEDEHIVEENESNVLDSTSDVVIIENEPNLPIVVEDTEEDMDNLVARMMDISSLRQNSGVGAGLTGLYKSNIQQQSVLNSETNVLAPMDRNYHETHNTTADQLHLRLNTLKSSRAKSSKDVPEAIAINHPETHIISDQLQLGLNTPDSSSAKSFKDGLESMDINHDETHYVASDQLHFELNMPNSSPAKSSKDISESMDTNHLETHNITSNQLQLGLNPLDSSGAIPSKEVSESMGTNHHETHNITSDQLQLGLNTPDSSGTKSAKEFIKSTSPRECFKRPLKNFIDLNEHPVRKKKKTKKETNIPKAKKNVPIKNKIIDGIVIPIIPQTTHSFRPLELVALSKGMTSKIAIPMEKSANFGVSYLQKSHLHNDTEDIIDEASQIENIPSRYGRTILSHALSGDETYFRDISIEETYTKNLSILSQHNSLNESISCHDESRKVENITLYQHIFAHITNWITFLSLQGVLNKTPYVLIYDSYLPVLSSMRHVSVESQVLIRLNEIFSLKIIGKKLRVHFKWNLANDNLLVAMLSAVVFSSKKSEWKGRSLAHLYAYEQILNQFRKYLKLNIRVEQRYKNFSSNTSHDKTDVTISSKPFFLTVLKFIEFCTSCYNDPM